MDCQMDPSVILRSGSETRRFHLACHLKQAGKGKRASFKFPIPNSRFQIFKMSLTPYQIQQRDALPMVRRYLEQEGPAEREALCARIADYLAYRRRLDRFLEDHFRHLCNVTCYQSALSACCAREAIITFFAELEQRFMAAGCRSPLMYCSTSPGLLNVKRRAAAGRQRS